ncbi:MAG: polyprenyl synthetase family protein [Lachnospiraceae bacterium]|nr:polyprenyl synthetase family protein [Lachnospiraceae bacterium]
MSGFKEALKARTELCEKVIKNYMPACEGPQKIIFEAMDYSVSAGGKRLRPMLMREMYELMGGTDEALIEPFMAAIEMIHTYSLIHDDLPALDNDDLRRGKPTSHKVFGEDMAILAGDALLNYAYETAAKAFDRSLVAEGCENREELLARTAKAMQILAHKPGVYGMIGGQTVDVKMTGKSIDNDTLDYIYENKTAALIECVLMIGAALAGAGETDIKAAERIGHCIGMAFQIRDDILDITGTAEELGKMPSSDEKNNKTTYASILGIEGAEQEVLRYSREAKELIEALPAPGDTGFMLDIVDYLAGRSN